MLSQSSHSQSQTSNALQRRELVDSRKKCMVQPIRKTIEKGRETRFHFERVLNFDYCLLLFSIINITLTIFYSDADYDGNDSITHICLLFIMVTLFVQIIATVFRYLAQIELEKCQKILGNEETIISSGKSYSLALEIFILLLQPYIFLNDWTVQMSDDFDSITFPFKINYILVFFGFFKLFIILRVVLIRQIYMSPRSSRLCRMYGCESNYLYAIKCLFKDTPMMLIGIVFMSSILVFALSLRIAERQIGNGVGKTTSNDISDFQNALWLTIITMTTVGYGDYYPRTTFGRVIDVLLVVWGTFIVSLMVVVLTNTLNMDQSEKRALIVLNRLQAKKALKQSAALLITHTCKKYLLKKQVTRGLRPPLTLQEQTKLQNSFYKYLTNFQSVHRTIRSMYEIDDVYEEMTRQFEFINEEINFLLKSQQSTIENLREYLTSKDQGQEGEVKPDTNGQNLGEDSSQLSSN